MPLRDIVVNFIARTIRLTGVGFSTPLYTTTEHPFFEYKTDDYTIGIRKQLTGNQTAIKLTIKTGAALAAAINASGATVTIMLTVPSATKLSGLSDYIKSLPAATGQGLFIEVTAGSEDKTISTVSSQDMSLTDKGSNFIAGDIATIEYYYGVDSKAYQDCRFYFNQPAKVRQVKFLSFWGKEEADILSHIKGNNTGDWYLLNCADTRGSSTLAKTLEKFITTDPEADTRIAFFLTTDTATEIDSNKIACAIHKTGARLDIALTTYGLTFSPGVVNWKWKQLQNIADPEYNSADLAKIRENKLITLENVSGLLLTSDGFMTAKSANQASIDQVRFRHWLVTEMESNLVRLLAGADSINFDNAGLAAINNALAKPFVLAGERRIIAPLEAGDASGAQFTQDERYLYRITIPKPADIRETNPTDYNARFWSGITFAYIENQKVDKVEVRGSAYFSVGDVV